MLFNTLGYTCIVVLVYHCLSFGIIFSFNSVTSLLMLALAFISYNVWNVNVQYTLPVSRKVARTCRPRVNGL